MARSKPGGLADVVAGETAMATVGKEGMALTYRGHSIDELAAKAPYEEVTYLLLYGHLPTRRELEDYHHTCQTLRVHQGELSHGG